jgi:predicted nucleic acid-binding protein
VSSICLDSSGWIEITHAGANAGKFAKVLSVPDTLILSTITLYEIARYTSRVAGETASSEVLTFLQQYPVIPVSAGIATLAASLSHQHKLAMADSLIYATTLSQNATLWTQDEDFEGLPHVKYFPESKS